MQDAFCIQPLSVKVPLICHADACVSGSPSFYKSQTAPPFILSRFSHSLIAHRPFLSERFCMQRYSVWTVAKYRCANGSRIFTAAFRKSKIDFQSPPHCRAWLAEPAFALTFGRLGIPFYLVHCLLALSSFSRCQSCIKIIPRQKAERASRRGK